MISKLRFIYRLFSSKYQCIQLDYKVKPKPRYGHGKMPHSLLFEIINKNRQAYRDFLALFLKYTNVFHSIKESSEETDINKPSWNNGFLPGLDVIGIYTIIAEYKPLKYIEIGSGNSTKVARKSIKDNNLSTEIISIDPYPRANIDHLADKIIREPFENIIDNKFIVETLKENDILFIDNSHRVFPNSDSMICFLEILPFLKKGVIVHFHDIYIPFDYPQFMCDRFYNEQYMLSSFIIANPEKFKCILPNYFISEDEELSKIISPVWNHPNLRSVEKHGGSFWIQIS